MKTFAAIDVGSYELAMKIYEISTKGKLREVDSIRHSIELGSDTYSTGKISVRRVDELCEVLKEFHEIMNSYGVDAYQAYGTSAIRETQNTAIILDQIKNRTGIKVDVISNSEQRFLNHKSIAAKGEGFEKIIDKGTAIVDIGGGSIQISLFSDNKLILTQNMRLGVLRMREKLQKLQPKTNHYEELISDMAYPQLSNFKKMYLKDVKIQNIIIIDDYISLVAQNELVTGERAGYMTRAAFMKHVDIIKNTGSIEIGKKLSIPEEKAILLLHSTILVKNILEITNADFLWAPDASLCDGIAYEYAEKNKLIKLKHDFEKDILVCADNISKRYMSSQKHTETLQNIALTIYDSMKKMHGLGKRERLLLQLAIVLSDTGKYVSMINMGECSYSIIMGTEIIGLSHLEREMVANIAKYNYIPFSYYEGMEQNQNLDKESYLVIAKLTAIFRLASGLDRTHKQKFKNIKCILKDAQLVITVDTIEDITLEKGLLSRNAEFFEEVYSVEPVIRQKRKF